MRFFSPSYVLRSRDKRSRVTRAPNKPAWSSVKVELNSSARLWERRKTDGVTFSNPSSVTPRINLLIENLLAITIALPF